MRLLLCKFAEELHFWAITLWTWVIIYVPLMSHVLIVNRMFVEQNILILFKRNPRVIKTSHMWKNLLIFFFCILIIDIFHFWRCSTKGAALQKEQHICHIWVYVLCISYPVNYWWSLRGVSFAVLWWYCIWKNSEAATRAVLWKKMFLEISQNSQENTCARLATLLKKRLWHRCFPVNL